MEWLTIEEEVKAKRDEKYTDSNYCKFLATRKIKFHLHLSIVYLIRSSLDINRLNEIYNKMKTNNLESILVEFFDDNRCIICCNKNNFWCTEYADTYKIQFINDDNKKELHYINKDDINPNYIQEIIKLELNFTPFNP